MVWKPLSHHSSHIFIKVETDKNEDPVGRIVDSSTSKRNYNLYFVLGIVNTSQALIESAENDI